MNFVYAAFLRQSPNKVVLVHESRHNYFTPSVVQNVPVSAHMRMILSLVASFLFLVANAVAADLAGVSDTRPEKGRFVEIETGYMVPYQVTIPGTEVSFWMEPVPGGEFLMGSPESEKSREESEGPQRKISVDPFWMARCEVTWAEYRRFMSLYSSFKSFEQQGLRKVNDENQVDAITAPTMLYEPEFTFEYGEDDELPAVTITQYSAKQYSKWMSAITECQFRIPTEAEWEYACRAGATTAYSFGDDPGLLPEYAWFKGNTEESGTRKVGQKKPNSWGLFDMHGNVAEWVLDSLEPYKVSEEPLNATANWVSSEELDPRIVRGGSWEFPAGQCRCASRLGSDSEAWREYDPNLPKSPWWFTTDPARGVGFRLVRPLATVPRDAMEEFWRIDNEATEYDVTDRLSEGRGVRGLVDKDLPEAIKSLQ